MTDLVPTPGLAPPEPAPPRRNLYLDALRGFAIILVVLGHAAQRATGSGDLFSLAAGRQYLPRTQLTLALFSFNYWHMPLFMAISGYLTWNHIKRPIPAWLNRKAMALLVPFAAWMLVYYWVPDPYFLKGDHIVGYIWLTVLNPSNGLWYLPVLFLFYVASALVEESPVGDWGFLLVGVFIAGLVRSPLVGVVQMQIVWWWFVIGYLFAKHQERLIRLKWAAWAVAPIAYAGALYRVVHYKDMTFVPLMNAAGIIGSTLLVWILVKLWLGRPMAYIGKHTLEIYAGEFLFFGLPLGASYLRIPAITVAAIAGSLVLGMLLRLTPLTNMLFLGGRYDRNAKMMHEAPPSDVLSAEEPYE